MEEKKYFKVLARDSKSGIGKDGMPYCFESLTIDFYGKSAKVGLSENMEVKPGHFVKLGFCTVLIWGSRGDDATYKASFFGGSQVQPI